MRSCKTHYLGRLAASHHTSHAQSRCVSRSLSRARSPSLALSLSLSLCLSLTAFSAEIIIYIVLSLTPAPPPFVVRFLFCFICLRVLYARAVGSYCLVNLKIFQSYLV